MAETEFSRTLDIVEMAKAAGGDAGESAAVKCPLCRKELSSLSELKSHLISGHPDFSDKLEALMEMIQQLMQQSRDAEKKTYGK